jgi:pimeloyl-ACP methyl ester carboxylesterase
MDESTARRRGAHDQRRGSLLVLAADTSTDRDAPVRAHAPDSTTLRRTTYRAGDRVSSLAREQTLDIEGRRILVRDVGSGPPVLLVNGLGAHTAMWATLERALSGLHVISFDAPGAGQSTTPRLPVSVRGVAQIARGVLDHFDVERADVVGFSMGGIVTQQLCADAPHRVRRAVLVATSPGVGGVHGNAAAMLNIATPVRYLSRRMYMHTIGSLAGGRARTDVDWLARHGALRLRHPPSIRGYLGQLASLAGWSGLPLLEHIVHPVLVVTGDDDPLTPVANAMLLTHLLPHGRVLVARGEGHLLLMDEDSRALEPIARFLAADDPEPDWGAAQPVTAAELKTALDEVGVQLQPFGVLSALQRRRFVRTAPAGEGA